MFDHVSWCDKEIVDEGGRRPDHQCLEKVDAVIFVAELELEVLVEGEVAGVGWDAPTGHYMGTFPESEQSFFLE